MRLSAPISVLKRETKALITTLVPGDLLLLGARPGHGKTLLGLELLVQATKAGRRGVFFTLECSEATLEHLFAELGESINALGDRFELDNSDDICADRIIRHLESARPGTVVVVDYLQILDHKRENPALTEQIKSLRAFARNRGLIIVFISQIHKSYDAAVRPCPTLADVRLPNPLDLTLFQKACFINDGKMSVAEIGRSSAPRA